VKVLYKKPPFKRTPTTTTTTINGAFTNDRRFSSITPQDYAILTQKSTPKLGKKFSFITHNFYLSTLRKTESTKESWPI